MVLGNAKQPSILNQMIAEAHEIREKQSAHRAHVINNVAIKAQNQADDSVVIRQLITLHRNTVIYNTHYKYCWFSW